MVESQERWKYGCRPGVFQRQQKGAFCAPWLYESIIELYLQVKRILVPQRENPIVNRLNKTKVEKFPDLAMEKEEKLKALRKKDQAAKLERVSFVFVFRRETCADNRLRKRKRQGLHRSGKRRSGRRIMPMMRCSTKLTPMKRTIRIEVKIGRTILCEFEQRIHAYRILNPIFIPRGNVICPTLFSAAALELDLPGFRSFAPSK
jgi:hypothetical protein